MTTLITRVWSLFLVIGLAVGAASAQDRPASPSGPQGAQPARQPAQLPTPDRPPSDPFAGPLIPLRVQLVIARYDGDRKISSQPYTLSVNAGSRVGPPQVARLRIGAEVPVSGFVPASPDGKPLPTGGPVQYKSIGTNIDCFAFAEADGRYRLDLTVEDSSVYASDKVVPGTVSNGGTPIFRSFRLTNAVILKDGQSAQFTAATDKITGEVVKLDVTVNAVK